MKRIFPLLLLLVLIPVLIVPASATSQGVINAIEDQTDSLGEWLGIGFADVVDRLDWLDDSVRALETQLEAILDELFVSATRTLGSAIERIYTYTYQINEKVATLVNDLYVSAEYTIGTAIDRIRIYTFQINEKLTSLLNGDTTKSEQVDDTAQDKQDELQDMEDVLSSAPTVNPGDIDLTIDAVNGKYEGMYGQPDGTLLFSTLGQISNLEFFRQIIPTSAMLGVLSFALFGRVF